jgi:hypothetical protein
MEKVQAGTRLSLSAFSASRPGRPEIDSSPLTPEEKTSLVSSGLNFILQFCPQILPRELGRVS